MDIVHTKNKFNFSYKDTGKGKTVVLIHGFLESKETWLNFDDKLSENYRAISIDLPGHGKSDLLEKEYSIDDYAEFVNQILDSEEISDVAIIGHSLGGYVALSFANLYPEKLTGLCLFHSSPFADTPEKITMREEQINLILSGKKEHLCNNHAPKVYASQNLEKFENQIETGRKIALSTPAKGIIASLQAMKSRKDMQEVFANLKIPCLYIIGANDNFIPLSVLKQIKMPEEIQICILENSGHIGYIEEFERSVSILNEFLG